MINISEDINDGFLQQFSMYDKLKLMKLGNNVKKEQKRTNYEKRWVFDYFWMVNTILKFIMV